ncbi:MAG: cytochrome b [Proteobacteria bacterium]|nr:cytochrome b [Pseudomonadota bacterium]
MRADPLRDPSGPGWGAAQRVLHWATALLVVAGFVIGLFMIGVPMRELLLKFVLFQIHKSFGLLVLLMVLARLALRFRSGRPAHAPMPRWQAAAAGAGQAAIYALLIVVPALGYVVASSSPIRIPTLFLGVIPMPDFTGANRTLFDALAPVHRWLAILLVALAAGHALMAVLHQVRDGTTLRRMWRG